MSASDAQPAVHRRELAVGPAAAETALAKAAEQWGADWRPEERRLVLPLTAGLRVGILQTAIGFPPTRDGCEVVLTVEGASWHLQGRAVASLVIAGAGGLVAVLWPLFPALLPLAPMGALMALGAWFLVVARLSTSTPDDFLQMVADLAEAPGES